MESLLLHWCMILIHGICAYSTGWAPIAPVRNLNRYLFALLISPELATSLGGAQCLRSETLPDPYLFIFKKICRVLAS